MGPSRQFEAPLHARSLADSVPGIYKLEPILAAALAAVALPFVAAMGTAIAVTSGRSPFVAHQRVGQFGQPFWMWKLRTMWPDADPPAGHWQIVERFACAETPEQNALSPGFRVRNRLSAFCRRHSIDELPQLTHVVVGQMSLVGPRPITKQELERYDGTAAETLQLRPGLTGLWRVSGGNSLTDQERYRLDLELVRKFSLRMYSCIVLKTIPKLIGGTESRWRGAAVETTARPK